LREVRNKEEFIMGKTTKTKGGIMFADKDGMKISKESKLKAYVEVPEDLKHNIAKKNTKDLEK
jgi:hypothetical protein